MPNRFKEFLLLARFAGWLDLDFKVGVLEADPNSRLFTVVIKSPLGVLHRRVPRSEMEGMWPQIVLDPSVEADRLLSDREQVDTVRRLIRSRLTKTIHVS